MVFDLNQQMWRNQESKGRQPAPRCYHVSFYDGTEFILSKKSRTTYSSTPAKAIKADPSRISTFLAWLPLCGKDFSSWRCPKAVTITPSLMLEIMNARRSSLEVLAYQKTFSSMTSGYSTTHKWPFKATYQKYQEHNAPWNKPKEMYLLVAKDMLQYCSNKTFSCSVANHSTTQRTLLKCTLSTCRISSGVRWTQ